MKLDSNAANYKVFSITILFTMLLCCLSITTYGANSTEVEKVTYYQKKGYTVLPPIATTAILPAGKYIAIDNFVIRTRDSLNIKSGTQIYFEPGYQFQVDGNLSIENNVVLTNTPSADRFFILNPDDTLWEGLILSKSGKLSAFETKICNSKNGIIAESDSNALVLNCVSFVNTQAQPFTFQSSHLVTGDTVCYTYKHTKQILQPLPGKKRGSMLTMYTAGGVALVSCIGALVAGHYQTEYYNKALTATDGEIGEKQARTSDTFRTLKYGLWSGCGISASVAIGIAIPGMMRGHK